MSPRLGVLASLLVVPALPLIVSAPAHAATNIICVNRPAEESDCNPIRPLTLKAALETAKGDKTDSIIRLGPGSALYADGPFVLDGSVDGSLTVQGNNNGAGANATILPGGSGTYVTATGATTIRNLRITLSGSGGTALNITGPAAQAQNVIVSDTLDPTGVDPSGATGIRVNGSKVINATVNLFRAADKTGNTGVQQEGGPSGLTRVTTRTTGAGVVVDNGTLAIDNSVIDLEATGTAGLRAGTADSTGAVTVDAKQLTVVGGSATTRGVWAFADDAGVTSGITLTNSIVRGPSHSLATSATSGKATIAASFSDLNPATSDQAPSGTITRGDGNLDVDPGFTSPAGHDYHLRSGSPVVDKGSLLLTIGSDRDDAGRAFDGDGNGTQIPDMGAYELRDITKPKTTFTAGPNGFTNDNTPLFQFKSEDGATFECRIDQGGWNTGCASPATTPPLADGPHTFSVRATDEAFNVESPEAVRAFTVDTVVPNTLITKKPQKRFFKQKVKFKFASTEPGVKFQCQLDKKGWKSCNATWKFNTKVGKHTLLVRAQDAAGNLDASPARYKFKRLKRGR